MSSVKGFSGPASEKIKLFFIGHRRRSAFFDAYLDAGWCRSACSDAVLGSACHTLSTGSTTPKEMGSAGRAVAQRTSETLALGVRLVQGSKVSAKVELGLDASVLLDASSCFLAFALWGGIRAA